MPFASGADNPEWASNASGFTYEGDNLTVEQYEQIWGDLDNLA